MILREKMIDMFNVKNADFEDVKLMSEIMVKQC